jgi:hypothetical protein
VRGEASRAEVRALFERLATRDFSDLPRDMFWLWNVAYLAEACVYLRDTRRAALLYDLLLPYGDHCLVMGQSGGCEGALARHLGQLAATLERWEDAADHLERALATADELGMTVRAERIRGTSRSPRPYANEFRREGEYWTIAVEGSGFRPKDERGLAYIAHLLARPNEQIHALELAAAGYPRASEGHAARRGDTSHAPTRTG